MSLDGGFAISMGQVGFIYEMLRMAIFCILLSAATV